MSRKITVDEARDYLSHVSQQKASDATPDMLTDAGFEYWAEDGVCGMFHPAHWPNVWMAHYAVQPSSWGKTTAPAKQILMDFWQEHQPSLIIGWTKSDNLAALSFARRIGFVETGQLDIPGQTVIQQSWRP